MRLSRIAIPLLLALVVPACAARTASAPSADGVDASADGRPVILNRQAALRSIQSFYPELLRDAQVTGEAVVVATLTAGGAVSATELASSTHDQFNTPSRALVRRLRFGGSVAEGQQVRVRIRFDRPGLSDIRIDG